MPRKRRNQRRFTFPASSFILLATLFASFAVASRAGAGFSLDFDPAFGSTEYTGAKAQIDFNFTDDAPPKGQSILQLNIKNLTDGSGSFDSSISTENASTATFMGFGFDLVDGVSFVEGTYQDLDGVFPYLVFDVKLNPLGTVDIAIQHNKKLQGGNPQGGLEAGQSARVQFALQSDPIEPVKSVESRFLKGFSDGSLTSVSRFQEVGDDREGSDKVRGGIHPVPEPGAAWLWLALTGLTVGWSLVGRRSCFLRA